MFGNILKYKKTCRIAPAGFFLFPVLRLGGSSRTTSGRTEARTAHCVHDASGAENDGDADTDDDGHTPGDFTQESTNTDNGDGDRSETFTGVAGKPCYDFAEHSTHRGVGSCHIRRHNNDGAQKSEEASLPRHAELFGLGFHLITLSRLN